MAFETRADVTLDECLAMAAGKTGSLLAASAAIGAVLAGAPPPTVEALRTFGAEVGLAFQLVDDVLGIWGDPAVTGKPVLSDLRARKKSLPVAYALGQAARRPGVRRLARRRRARPTPSGVGARRRPGRARPAARDWALDEARRRMVAAEQALCAVDLDPGRAGRAARARPVRRGPGLMTQTAPARTDDRRKATPAEALARAVDHLRSIAGPRRLVEGRAGDQRHDGRRGPAAARVPRHPRRRRRPTRPPAGSARSSARTAPGRLPRRTRRPVDDRRGLHRAAAGR